MSNIEQSKQDLQKSLFKKLEKITDLTESNVTSKIKRLVTNKAIPNQDRVTLKELEVAKEYFKKSQLNTNTEASVDTDKTWSSNAPLEKITGLTSKVIDSIIKDLEKQEKPSSSLIPIKGISKVMQAKLRS